ncbi:hypothetical protein L3Q82_017360 [Scortum barcoo]|uniref:Uncharacterized protein n=1 Tax=Scortum barcoo TaxID=214431 RepID=A0ACB8VLE0_9TELE|nr:hypothetical protein L3Q82_017360 [Scortum barcoo]
MEEQIHWDLGAARNSGKPQQGPLRRKRASERASLSASSSSRTSFINPVLSLWFQVRAAPVLGFEDLRFLRYFCSLLLLPATAYCSLCRQDSELFTKKTSSSFVGSLDIKTVWEQEKIRLDNISGGLIPPMNEYYGFLTSVIVIYVCFSFSYSSSGMKTPLSPSQLLESGQILAFGGMCQELMDVPIPTTISLSVQQTPSPGGQGSAYSLCEVCNLQLTSAAQAQLHYNGRSHLRRVRQLQAGETGQQAAAGAQSRSLPQATVVGSQYAGLTPTPGPGLSTPSSTTAVEMSKSPPFLSFLFIVMKHCGNPPGSGCGAVGGALPGLIGATGPSVMMKPFLPFPVETTSPVGLFPNFNTMDPVQKAVINHTFGVTLVPKKKQVISCNVCQLRFNSDKDQRTKASMRDCISGGGSLQRQSSRQEAQVSGEQDQGQAVGHRRDQWEQHKSCRPRPSRLSQREHQSAHSAPSRAPIQPRRLLLASQTLPPPLLLPSSPPPRLPPLAEQAASLLPPALPPLSQPPGLSSSLLLLLLLLQPPPLPSSSSSSSSSSSKASPPPPPPASSSSSSKAPVPLLHLRRAGQPPPSSLLRSPAPGLLLLLLLLLLLPPPPPPAPDPLLSPPPPSSSSSQDAPLSVESEEEKAKKLLYCSLCKVAVNSLSQLEAHNAGSKHKTMLEARSGAGPIKAYPRPGAKLKTGSSSALKGSGLQNKTFHCQICDVHVNSEIQLKQHISSRRHKDRVAGKPSKPKYSPYNKQQRSSLTVSVSLPLSLSLSLRRSWRSPPSLPPSSPLPSLLLRPRSPPPSRSLPPLSPPPPSSPPPPRLSPPRSRSTLALQPPRPSSLLPSCVRLLDQSEQTKDRSSSRPTDSSVGGGE